MIRVQELCRKLKPVLGSKIDRIYRTYLAEDSDGKADLEQTLELLASRHLGQDYELDRSPFPPPPKGFSISGQIPVGNVSYGQRELYPFLLRADRLKEHVLICGRSGSGKTNLTFELMRGMMTKGIKVLALDWKRGYRDLLSLQSDLHVYTIGRTVAPLRFNPLIPPPGCEPGVWIKLIVDVIASAYLGGEGVISLLIGGLDHLYREFGIYDNAPTQWPTIADLLAWLRNTKLKGRAAMWQASAERILLAMCYGEFASVVNTQNNSHVEQLLDHNVVLEMDGLSSQSDRVMFSEALTLWLYRYRLAQGPRNQLTNVIILEEAHNLLLAKQAGAKESVLETSIRMIRQYGLGYIFVDQSASLLSKVAFANSYATLALSQKLSADVRAMAGAMNLNDEQKQSLSTLPIGTTVVRLADQYPEPFLVKIPRCPIQEGIVTDSQIQARMAGCTSDSRPYSPPVTHATAIPVVSFPDNKGKNKTKSTHPPTPERENTDGDTIKEKNSDDLLSTTNVDSPSRPSSPQVTNPSLKISRESIRFIADVSARPLSTTVSRYQRLNLSRRKGNAIRQDLSSHELIDSIPIATRSGQVMLYQLTEAGRQLANQLGIDPGPRHRTSLEHQYWVLRCSSYFEKQGYEITHEYVIKGNGAIDVLAKRPGQKIAVEVETGKSDIQKNIQKVRSKGFDKVILIATSPSAVTACQKAIDSIERDSDPPVELMTWLDVS